MSEHGLKHETKKLPEKGEYIQSLFKIQTANECIEASKLQPPNKSLFECFWYEKEVCILFADTNAGKSIMAIQIAEALSHQHKVGYLDFELSPKQFEARYSDDYKNHFVFNNNFFRIELDPDADYPDGVNFEDYLIAEFESIIKITGIKIWIIDNITYLNNETDKAKHALALMKRIKKLARAHGLSILEIAHTPKRDPANPITKNDLAGSRMLMSFCDSSFAIGESNTDKSVRYLKQIKVREGAFIHDAENVKVYQIKKDVNFLKFDFVGYSPEWEHLKQREQTSKEDKKAQAIILHGQGKSYQEIADIIGVRSKSTVSEYIHGK